ncbi:hypothetical protein [Cutibacterium granulosum]|uniref:hypothetical protein n=1 Tax=Cutibacterium granulosum TaxID=33011 RepID=UPI0023F6A856|nr:hypothetical protein [Cutibacterium granulosum]
MGKIVLFAVLVSLPVLIAAAGLVVIVMTRFHKPANVPNANAGKSESADGFENADLPDDFEDENQ